LIVVGRIATRCGHLPESIQGLLSLRQQSSTEDAKALAWPVSDTPCTSKAHYVTLTFNNLMIQNCD
jgi:hypothetical protein